MESMKYHHITGRDHSMLNPSSIAKLRAVLDLMQLKPGQRVLDMGCGKGAGLLTAAEFAPIQGTGVDISPVFVDQARNQAAALGQRGNELHFVVQPGQEFMPTDRFDVAMCLGASWIFGSTQKTLARLAEWVVAGGFVLLGEPYLIAQPSATYLAALSEAGFTIDAERSHGDNARLGEQCGLTPLYALASDVADYDHYEWLRIRAAELYVLENPSDPDTEAILKRARTTRDLYLDHGRYTVNWSLYLYQKTAD